jgi:hypothetical protein
MMPAVNRAPFAAALALTVSAALGVFFAIAPVALLTLPATDLPEPFFDQHQDAETLLFLLAFAVILPAAVVLVPRVADRIAAANGAGASAFAALLATTLAAALLFVKVSKELPWGGGLKVLLATMVVWCAVAAVAARRAAAGPWPALAKLAPRAGLIWSGLAILVLALTVALAILGSIDVPVLLAALAVAAIAFAVQRRVAAPRLPRWLGIAIDVAAVVLVFLSVPNLVVIRPEDPSSYLETSIVRFHQDFFLGPASHVVNGGAMLVDNTVSQYGVGSIYAIAGWFEIAGVTNGMVGLFEGLLAATVFACAYLVLRAAGVGRILAVAAMAVGLVVFVWGLSYPIGGLLQHGAIRFGLPMAVLLAAVAGARKPAWSTPARVVALVAVGVSSIWALEAFAYTLLTTAGVFAALAWAEPAGARRRWLLRRIAEVVAACVVTHVLFALATLIGSGELPDWSLYLTTLRAFLVGKIGELTYDFSPWSPGVGLGVVYLASGAALALLMLRAPRFARSNLAATVALAGGTAYGVALFSYLVNRSADHIVPYVSLPALIVAVVWLSLLMRAPAEVPARVREAALAMALAVSALLVAVAWSGVGDRFEDSAIAYVPPGGKSLGDAIERLEDFPPISPGTAQAERMIERYWPGEKEALVVLTPDATVEVLARTGRNSELPLSDPWEDSFVPEQHLDSLAAAIDELEPGDRIMLDENALSTFEDFRRDPTLDPMKPQVAQTIVPSGLAVLQIWALDRIGERFRLRVIERGTGPEHPLVAELVAAEPGAGGGG